MMFHQDLCIVKHVENTDNLRGALAGKSEHA